MSASIIAEVAGAVRRHGRVNALAGVDLVVRGGDTVLLLGANGAGKSTLLRLLAGLTMPRRGVVRIAGRDATRDSAVRGMVGYVSHHAMVYDDLTAFENVRFAAVMASSPDPGRSAREALESVGLARRSDAPVRTFSRGMLQRISLARALVGKPSLLLLDEPFTGLDREGTALLRGIVMHHRAAGGATVCVTHEPASFWDLADRLVVMEAGRITLDAARPATLEEIMTAVVAG